MKTWLHAAAVATTAACLAAASGAASAQDSPTVRVGYWAGGVSAGIGLTLETERFLEKQGLDVEFTRFGRLGEVNRALISQSIDVAVAGGTIPTLLLAQQGVPATVILANLIADANFVVAPDSEITGLDQLAGTRIGSTPEGSTAYALVGAILEQGYDIPRDAYEHVGAGEGQLATLVTQGDLDVALLRTITLRTLDTDLETLATVPDEWRRILDIEAPPVLGVAVVSNDFLSEHPDLVDRYVAANIAATRWGAENPDKVAAILEEHLTMTPQDAAAYASAWDRIYFASLTDEDIESVLGMANMMRAAGEFEGEVPMSLFDQGPYQRALKMVE